MKRIIIVTGASSGLGREFALQLARTRNVDEIWLLARRKEKLELLAKELQQEVKSTSASSVAQNKIGARVVEIDLSGTKGPEKFSDLLKKEQKACRDTEFVIDTLVNNAGFGTYGTFIDTDLQRQIEMIDVNVSSLTALCYLSLPYMKSGSLIINVASLAGYIPLGNFAVYGATKAYVLNFSIALAAEVADAGIFVSTVCPGPVDTEFANVASKGARVKVVDGRDPAAVVSHCLHGIKQGKRISIMAPKWKFKAFFSRFVSRYGFARYSYVHEKRPSH